QDVFKKVTEGKKDLKDAVKDITGKTAGYLGENDFEQNGLLEEIATPVFDAKQGDVIGPVQTALGWHVLVLKEVIEPQVEPFDKVKAGIKDEIMQTRLLDDLVNASNMLDDQLAGGEELETVVKEMGLTTEEIKNFNQAGVDGNGKDLFAGYQGDKAQILEAAFDFDVGESSPVMELADGRYVTVRVDEIKPLTYQSYDSVKDKLKNRWIAEQKELANRARAEDAFAKVQSGTPLTDVAKEYGASMQSYTKISRTQAPKAPLDFPTLKEIFEAKPSEPLKLGGEDSYLIGEVTSVSLPSTDKAAEDIAKLQEETEELLPQEIMTQYINALSQKYNVKINDRVLKSIYGGSTDS
ncbi:MAG TPA: peptidyl-prolyl cis-trans isomerase, partial [Alphaproteobacteria bacterium]|nr:peptidyl-prolyl cis-trans isomerase [Alphaproteobacteria bacterium]